jgi:RNA polymerase sigma-70 factor (ECF subfamily)
MDDQALLERIRLRDPDALLALYRLYGGRVYSLAYRILREPTTAEEVVQDTFWKLWQRPELFNPQAGVLIAWLVTVSRHLAIDRKRNENRRASKTVLLDMDALANGPMAPEMEALADPTAAVSIRRVMQDLPSDQKEVVELAYFEELTHSEISERLNTPLGTVKSRLRLALGKLRQAMTAHRSVKQ